MPSIYDIIFSQRIIELLPPDKRYSRMSAWFRAIAAVFQRLHLNVFVDYRTGSNYPVYAAGTYNAGDRVIYGQRVYESIDGSNTTIPTDLSKWFVYQNSFLGVDERLKYNGQILVLDYACNARFKTNFRQPPLQSDIYFEINTPTANVFVVGFDEPQSGISFFDGSSNFIINDYSFSSFYNFVVKVPTAVFNALSDDVNARSKIIRNFIDGIVPAGFNYTIITY